ncbi:MAG: DUF4192 domain-containing protein [Marmoricola sp.]
MTAPYVATGPEDLIALAPTVLRFEPENSVVVMTFGRPGRSFHARVSLPRRGRDQDEVADTILTAMKNNHLRQCAVLLYSDDRDVATSQGRKLNRKLRNAGIRVADVILVSGDRYFRVLRGDEVGTAFDVSAHPFTARRVVDGVMVHKSRAELAATLLPEPSEEESWGATIEAVRDWTARGSDTVAEGHWLRSTIPAAVARGSFSGAELPRVLADLLIPDLSDVAWAEITRADAEAQVALWRDAVKRAPADYVAAPACLLAFAAWLAGDGALAWCGLDRCGPTGPPMARMLTELLEAAVPPALWPGLSAEELSALRGPAA